MRKLLGFGRQLCSDLFALAVVIVVSPILWAMRLDREERNRANALDRVAPYPYDDNDPGTDVDEEERTA